MKHIDYNAPARSWKHFVMVALYCFVWFGCSGCASDYRPGETSDEEYKRKAAEQQEMEHYILTPGTVLYSK